VRNCSSIRRHFGTEGRTVYIGDFIYIKDRVVVLRKGLTL
jgi:hypothetical protein